MSVYACFCFVPSDVPPDHPAKPDMPFLHDDFFLTTDTARRLYHQAAADQPIYDYHCHLDPADIAANRVYDNLHDLWLEGDHYIIGCSAPMVHVGRIGETPQPIPLPSYTATVSFFQGVPIVATFGRELLYWQGDKWSSIPSPIGVIRSFVPTDQGVAIHGELGELRMWNPVTGQITTPLPGRARSVLPADDGLITVGNSLRRWQLPERLEPYHFDLTEEGGVAFMDFRDQTLLVGSATGNVTALHLDTGVQHEISGRTGQLARAGAILDDHYVWTDQRLGTFRAPRDGGPAEFTSITIPKRFLRHGNQLWGAAYTTYMMQYDDGSLDDHTRTGQPIDAMAYHDGLHVVDRDGQRWRFQEPDTLEPGLRFPAVVGGLLIDDNGTYTLEDRSNLVRRDTSGRELWRRTSPNMFTSMAVHEDWVIVGDRQGNIEVVSHDGQLQARVAAHRRRISGLAVDGDTLWSGSWDGAIKRWGLQALALPRHDVLEAAETAWGTQWSTIIAESEASQRSAPRDVLPQARVVSEIPSVP